MTGAAQGALPEGGKPAPHLRLDFQGADAALASACHAASFDGLRVGGHSGRGRDLHLGRAALPAGRAIRETADLVAEPGASAPAHSPMIGTPLQVMVVTGVQKRMSEHWAF